MSNHGLSAIQIPKGCEKHYSVMAMAPVQISIPKAGRNSPDSSSGPFAFKRS